MTPLRIGVDAREVLGDATGVGRYLGELLRRWTSRADVARRRFVLYSPEPLVLPLPADGVEVRIVPGGRGTWWEQTSLRRAVRRDTLDVFFAPAYTAPLGLRVPLAVTIHDVSFMAHPEWFRTREGLRRRWLTRRAAASASVVLTVSEFSRSEIAKYTGVTAAKIRVILNGVTAPPSSTQSGPPGREPMVLYVGSILNRRRVTDLIAAFAMAARDLPAARLVIVGGNRAWPPVDLAAAVREQGVADRVALCEYVNEPELAALYHRASVFGFLSEYEGFGLTPLEAMAAGVPPVVLDTPVAREVYGDAAAYVEQGDIAGTAAALRQLLTEPAAAESLRARAPGILARYSWQRAADDTLAELERMAGTRR